MYGLYKELSLCAKSMFCQDLMRRSLIQNYYIQIVIGTQFSYFILGITKSSCMKKKIQNEFETLAPCLTNYFLFYIFYMLAKMHYIF
jgi:hypothetical protein